MGRRRRSQETPALDTQLDNCVSELWSPRAVDIGDSDCFGTGIRSPYSTRDSNRAGDLTVPGGLYAGVDPTDTVRDTSSRDSDNNILVYWDAGSGELPADSALCWMFVFRLNQLDENY